MMKKMMQKQLALALSTVLLASSPLVSADSHTANLVGPQHFEPWWHIASIVPAEVDWDFTSHKDNIYKVTVFKTSCEGDVEDVQFRHRDIALTKGSMYVLSFEVISNNSGVLYSDIGNTEHSMSYSGKDTFMLEADELLVYSKTFTTDSNIENAEWAFFLGTDSFSDNTVFEFRNISLTRVASEDSSKHNRSNYAYVSVALKLLLKLILH
jgi:hypothetical protein